MEPHVSLTQFKEFHDKVMETPYGEVLVLKDTEVRSRLIFQPSTGDGIPGIFVFRDKVKALLDPALPYGIMIVSPKDTTLYWFRGGTVLHRDVEPAIINYGRGRDDTTWVTRYFVQNGKRHRDNGPAVETYRGVGRSDENVAFSHMIGIYHQNGRTISSLQSVYGVSKGETGLSTDVVFGLPAEFHFQKGVILNDTPWDKNVIPVLFWMRDLTISIAGGSIHMLPSNFNRIEGSILTSADVANFQIENTSAEGVKLIGNDASEITAFKGLRKGVDRNEPIHVHSPENAGTMFGILANYDILRGGLMHSDLRHMFMYDILGADA